MFKNRILKGSILIILGAVSLFVIFNCPKQKSKAVMVTVDSDTGTATPPTAFYRAVMQGDIEFVRKYLQAGVKPDVAIPQPAPSELLQDVSNSTAYFQRLLHERGFNALMLSSFMKQNIMTQFLLDTGADPESHTVHGVTALDISANLNSIDGMQMLLGVTPESDAAHLSLRVNLSNQQVTLSRDGSPIITSPISSGKASKPTPRGTYVVTQKYVSWHSTLYDSASMPYFMRLSCSSVGLHAGYLPGYPASHGCIRLPSGKAQRLYSTVPRGTLVKIE